MVKPDVKVNYYAALEISTDASVDEIKKQYRKLALKYHPDRNQGRETEVTIKFQSIQAAHEILTDPTSKSKYDLERRKAGLYPTFTKTNAPSRSNPFDNTSAWPPPPRRAATSNPSAPKAESAPRTPFGAFGKGTPRAAPTSKKEEHRDSAGTYSAWQNMKNTQNAQAQFKPQAQSTPQRPRPAPRADTRHPFAGDSIPRHHAGNEDRPAMNRSSTARTPRKAGFDPTAQGSDEDERQASGTFNYSTQKRHDERPAASAFSSPPPRAQPTRPDPFHHWPERAPDAPYAEGTRVRTPYSSYIGEQTYFSSEQLRRSQSTRDASKMQDASRFGAAEQDRHRSASPKRPAPKTGSARRPFLVSSDSEASDNGSTTSPESGHSSGIRSRDQPGPNVFGRKTATPTPPSRRSNGAPPVIPSNSSDSGFSGSNKADADNPNSGPGAKAKPSMYGSTFTLSPAQIRELRTPLLFELPTFSSNSQPASKGKKPWPSWAIPSTVMPRQRGSASQQARPEAGRSAAEFGAAQQAPASRHHFSFISQKSSKDAVATPEDATPLRGVQHRTSGFEIPIDTDTFTSNANVNASAKSRSEENINLNFSPSQWEGTFQGNTGLNIFAVPPRKPSPIKRGSTATSKPLSAQPSVRKTQSTQVPPLSTAQSNPQAASEGAGFSADVWKESAFDFGPTPSRSASRDAVNKRPSRANVKASSNPKPASAESLDEVEEVSFADTGLPGSSADDAMDIDPATPPVVHSPPAHKGPRVYAVPPSAWRQSGGHNTHGAPQLPSRAGRPPSVSQRKGSANLQTNLDDLAQSLNGDINGLDGLGDIRSTLPFTSKASSTNPVKSFEPRKLQLPHVPVAPQPPPKLGKTSWVAYCKDMSVYLIAFHKFNKTLVDHFNSRLVQESALCKAGVKALEAIGEGASSGILSYGQAVKEDEGLRECWNVGHERHITIVAEFERIKERVRRLSEGPGLSEA